jgi:hypothetical protein
MTDLNQINMKLVEIRLMISAGITSAQNLLRSDREGYFEIPEDDSEFLYFCLFDVLERVEKLQDGLWPSKQVVLIGEE